MDPGHLLRVHDALPAPYQSALLGHLRAARDGTAMLAELEAIASGMHPPAYPWATIGRAMHELAVAGSRLTPKALRAFCRDLEAPPADSPPSRAGPGARRASGAATGTTTKPIPVRTRRL